MATFLIMAGGTGGHVMPALALADALRARTHQVVWMGTVAGIEARLVPAAGYPIEWISVSGLRGRPGWRGALAWLFAPFTLSRALWQARRAIGRVDPQVVIGMGGFASGPGGIAAWLARRPLIVHEQNAVPGATNRILARFASAVFEAFPGSFQRAECVGNPVRATIVALPAPRVRTKDRAGRVRLLVLGGSQGASALNVAVPRALTRLATDQRPEVRHQAGAKSCEATRAEYAAAGVAAEVSPFIDDMAAAYGWADLVVCRAGAMTVSEIAAAGISAVFVPFPAATDDHQTANARWLTDIGAARLLPQSELSAERLAALLQELSDRAVLLEMAERARSVARTDTVALLVGACERFAVPAAKEAA